MPDPGAGIAGRVVLALVIGQVGIHASMAGLRIAAPLQTLREGYGAWSVGMLMAVFAAAPVLLALWSGRMADRYGYHRPVHIGIVLTVLGGLLAVASTYAQGRLHFCLLIVGGMFAGAGANMGMLAIQRTAGQAARNAAERVRIFSWLGVAPSLANVVGAVSAGFMIDYGGFGAAYALMLALPLLTLVSARWVPRREAAAEVTKTGQHGTAWNLLRAPGMKRLLVVNWLISACWDVHSFAVPLIGHEYGYTASTIGLISGTFTLSVTLVRLVIPMLAHRVSEIVVLRAAMVTTGVVLVLYPFAKSPWLMAGLSALLGVGLGAVQPMIMATLHQITPDQRHGEALAFRSMAINLSSTVMPLLFGAAGVAVGVAALFWVVGASVALGSHLAVRLAHKPAAD